ncbi:autotransporter outer membrane beta-barrel domain-containing protein [Ochrobactrum haematophilum]|uniref:Autotransporter outer membrane beta-barrel domain-containing protein n=1 Tax=Brucella haematophila TaxID=419474 RepID=A0ABX1DKQ4_9HYPH|nr:autotransporter outer membrane beta-barrel domain-containing protein [Brucella haematophila]
MYLSDQATLNVESDFVIASSIGAKGKLYIGNPTTLVAPGSVTARSIHFGDGDGEVILNHTAPVEAPYVLDMPISGTGTITNLNGATYLTANNTYTGPTSVKAGLLGLIGSGVSDISVSGGTLYVAGSTTGAVDLQIGGTLTGSGSVGNLTNAGIINPSRNTSTYGLTINGDYIGKGGTLVIDAVTGDDSSVTDTLIIKGSTSGGATLVVVNGLSGIGTKPHHDIRIVSVGAVQVLHLPFKRTTLPPTDNQRYRRALILMCYIPAVTDGICKTIPPMMTSLLRFITIRASHFIRRILRALVYLIVR